MGVVAKVTLDSETFKALASPTRLSVLRALDQRRKTVTELARDLDMNKATIHEHLQLLAVADLVLKKDEGRKWIYYELTWRGQRILHPQETTTFNLLLGVAVAAFGGGFALLGKALEWWWADRAEPEQVFMPFGASESDAPDGEGAAAAHRGADDGSKTAADASNSFWDEDGILAVAVLALSILAAVLAGLLWRRLRPRGSPAPDAA